MDRGWPIGQKWVIFLGPYRCHREWYVFPPLALWYKKAQFQTFDEARRYFIEETSSVLPLEI